MSSEKFSLKWSNFQSNVSKSFSSLRNEKEFSDVTLISDDRRLLPAHKVVLSTCSEYFKDILTKSKHHNPLICLEGVTDADLNRVLDYIYYGEIQVYQEYLEKFLHLARRFQLDGLTFGNSAGLTFENNVPPEARSKSSEEETPERVPPPAPKALLVKEEHLDTSFLPELVDGKILEANCERATIVTEKSGEEEQEAVQVSEDVEVEWYFLKTRKSSRHSPGVLITHSDKYKFQSTDYNVQTPKSYTTGKKMIRWTCSEKVRTKCTATAVVRMTTIPGKNGEQDMIDYKLVRVAPEGTHALYHDPVNHKIQAEKIMIKLKSMATDNMFENLYALEKRVLEEELWSKYPEEEAKLIHANMPVKIYNTLCHNRQILREKHLKSLEGEKISQDYL